MRIVYLDSTRDDLLWMRHYYEVIFPQDRENAQKKFHSTEQLLHAHPFTGHKTHIKDVYEFSIPKTPFSYIYRVKPDHIVVLRIWDERQGSGQEVEE